MSTTSINAGAELSSEMIATLRSRINGHLSIPGDAGWDLVRAPWLLMVEQQPLAVLDAADADDVAAAVAWADEAGVQVLVQPTGHGAHDAAEGALIVRTGRLDDISVDVEAATVRIGAGVSAGALAAALAGTGLTFLVGSNPHPSATGLTLGGGLSWFGRAFGLGCDSILAADVVDGTGWLRRVDGNTDPELLWALRGGGGDLAIVVALELALHPAPTIHGGQLLWPAEAMADVLRAFRDISAAAPDTFTAWWHALNFPPLPEVPEPLRGGRFTAVVVTHLGGAAELDELLAPLRAVPGTVMDAVGPVPVERVPELAGEPTEPGYFVMRSTLLNHLDDATVDSLVAVIGPETQCPLGVVQIRQLGGALARPGAGGCHGPIAEPFVINGVAQLPGPELAPMMHGALAEMIGSVAGASAGRTVMNFIEHGQAAQWWDQASLERLRAVKAASDPRRILRSNRALG